MEGDSELAYRRTKGEDHTCEEGRHVKVHRKGSARGAHG